MVLHGVGGLLFSCCSQLTIAIPPETYTPAQLPTHFPVDAWALSIRVRGANRNAQCPAQYSSCGSATRCVQQPARVRNLAVAAVELAPVPADTAVSASAIPAAVYRSAPIVSLTPAATGLSSLVPGANCSRARCTIPELLRDLDLCSIPLPDHHRACCAPYLCPFPVRKSAYNFPRSSKNPAPLRSSIFLFAFFASVYSDSASIRP